MTTTNGHLNGTGILVALGIMGGLLFVACVSYLVFDFAATRRRKRRVNRT